MSTFWRWLVCNLMHRDDRGINWYWTFTDDGKTPTHSGCRKCGRTWGYGPPTTTTAVVEKVRAGKNPRV